ncbi:MAG: D-alanine--D-alanine ligase [Oscillospiraceae bacterium]|nr:D-alanine--D-alanine ligase [Oscillospiraceae bacterium]
MNIAVLCGGLSAERDVSLSTGALAAAALRRLGHRVVTLDLFLGRPGDISCLGDIFTENADAASAAISETAPDIAALRASRPGGARVGENVFEICRAADIVFLALHGEDGEDGKIQAAFDLLGIKYTGTGFLGSAIAMSKPAAKRVFYENGVKTPRAVSVYRGAGAGIEGIGFPCFVKPCSGGSSVGARIVSSEAELPDALEFARQFGEPVIVEEYIRGREFNVGVLMGRALPVIEICPDGEFYDYKNKYQEGVAVEICPAELPPELTEKLQRTAETVFRALEMQVYARMDFIVDGGGEIWCLEGNTLPGLTPTSLLPQEAAAAGISYDELIGVILRESLNKYDGE